MENIVVKKERTQEAMVKVERTEDEVQSVILETVHSLKQQAKQEPLQDESYILKNLLENSEESFQISAADDSGYTYIIENPQDFDGTTFELGDGDHYIIEEYHANFDDSQDGEYETVYIEHVDSPNEEELSEVYTMTEVRENTEEDNQSVDIKVADIQKSPARKKILRVSTEKKQITDEKGKEKKSRSSPVLRREKMEIDEFSDEMETETISEESATEEKLENSNSTIIYECSICGKDFKTPTGVKRHITSTHNKEESKPNKDNDVLAFSLCPCCGEPSDSAHTLGDFKCDECDKLFIHQNSLQRHRSIDHPIGDMYECHECQKTFDTKELIIDHVRIHPIKSVKCEGCGRDFTRKYHLERHIIQTGCTGAPKSVYDCRVCGKIFARKDNLGEHLKGHAGIVSKKKKKYTCEFCMKEFTGMALLNIHVRTHTGERPYGCDLCEKKFPSIGAMKKHRRMHTGEKPYSCPQCGKTFAAKETLNRHWRTHTGEKPHQCKYCGKSFIQASQLRAHVFHHTGETAYTCPHCNRAFTRKLRLTTHIKFMHEGAQPMNCSFPGCTKTFFRNEDISRHWATHTGEKPFECDVCQKAFAVKSSLRIHKLTHRNEAPVTCEVCRRAFIRQDCLMRHMRAKHRDVIEDILANAEKRRLQVQLLKATSVASQKDSLKDTTVWNELTLTESIKELITLLVDEECLVKFGHPEAPVDKVLESVIKKCGYNPASEEDFDYIGRMRENAKLLFKVVVDDESVKELLNSKTVDEVIVHVLKLARKQLKEDGENGKCESSEAEKGDNDGREEESDEYEIDDPVGDD